MKETISHQSGNSVAENKCEKCGLIKYVVNNGLVEPTCGFSSNDYFLTDRQCKIDNFIIYFPLQSCVNETLTHGEEIVKIESSAPTHRKVRGWRVLTNCPQVLDLNMTFSPWMRWKARRNKPSKIQQLDGGFFERFGSGLEERQQSVIAEEEEEVAKATTFALQDLTMEPQIDLQIESRMGADVEDLHETTQPEPEPESESEPSKQDSDSEHERDASDYFSVGFNIDELYLEVLFEILHNVGCDVSLEIGQTALFSYAQDAFKMSNQKHSELMSVAEQKEAPEILLNVEVIEAKELVPKDSNGLSDPFVTLYLASNAAHRYNTSVKMGTLNPVWEEHFALPISDEICNDTLCLEIWDFDPAETVKEKLGKITQVKGVKGLRKLVKEIAVTATTGQHDNELIGKANIPLKAIPASGLVMWYSLDKKNKPTRRGVVKVRLAFSSEKNSQVAAQEHRHLLKILLLHELEMSKVSRYWWCGAFSPQAEAIITQHSTQSGLSGADVHLAQWAVYCTVHAEHRLSFSLFNNLLDRLHKTLQSPATAEDTLRTFWEGAKRLLPSCFSVVRKIRKKTAGDKNMMNQVTEVLQVLSKLFELQVPEGVDLLPAAQFGWLSCSQQGPSCDLRGALGDAVAQGAADWFSHVLDSNAEECRTSEARLQFLIKVVQLVRSDLQKAIEIFDKVFQESVHFQYARMLYRIYEGRLAEIVEADVKEACRTMKKLTFPSGSYKGDSVSPEEPLAMGTTLFELYLTFQRFVMLGLGLCPTDCDTFKTRNFHLWFHEGVAQWLDIAVYKALQRIKKAVELDTLVPVDESVKYSSSAVDTIAIFHQVKIFWQQLNWPDIEGSYTFVAKMIDDICRCCVFFADNMSGRVEGMGVVQDTYATKFEVTREWCLAINNIDYVRQSLKPFTEELGMVDLLKKLSDLCGPMEADRCKQTLYNVIANAIDTVQNKIIELIEKVAKKMSPAMKRLLIEGAEILHQDSNSLERVMQYLDNNLMTLHENLNEDNFNRILEIIWDMLEDILYELIQANLENRRPPSFFSNLHETLKLMIRSFKQDEGTSQCEQLMKIERLLTLNGMETIDLVHQVYLDQWATQKTLKSSNFGMLTVKLKFSANDLHIEILNARNLAPMDSNGSSDSFVRVSFLPEERFVGVAKPKTQTHNKNLFPLYDERFMIPLTPEQRKLRDGLVMFLVKDKDFLTNQYLAEAFVHFSEIPDTPDELAKLDQVLLPLNRPVLTDSEPIKALEHRHGDKLAKEFLKKYKQKVDVPKK